jgi:hypothetical protein
MIWPYRHRNGLNAEALRPACIDSKSNYRTKLTTVCARVLGVRKIRLNIGELVELAGVKNFNDYGRHSRSLDSASRVVGMGLRLKDVFSFV